MITGDSACASGDSSSAPPTVKGFAPQPIRYGHPGRFGDGGMGSQGVLDLKRPHPITSHDDHLIGASREWGRVLGVLVRMIAGQILPPIEMFYQGQEENFSPQGLRGNPAAPCSHGRPGTPTFRSGDRSYSFIFFGVNCDHKSLATPMVGEKSGELRAPRRRTGRLFPQLPAAHRPLAERAAGGSLHRGRLRGPDPRARTSHPADHRGLRLGVARRVPAPRMQSAGCEHPQQVAGGAADLSHLRRPLATLRSLAGTTARTCRRRVGTGRGYRPIVIGLKQSTSPERHEDILHKTDSA